MLAIRKTARIHDELCTHFGTFIPVSSFFRCKALNDRISGRSTTSQHMSGEAIDLDCDAIGKPTNAAVFHYIRKHVDFDQLIWEHGTSQNPEWVHVSSRLTGRNRREILRTTPGGYVRLTSDEAALMLGVTPPPKKK